MRAPDQAAQTGVRSDRVTHISRAPTARAHRVRRRSLCGVIVLLAGRMIEKVIEEEIGHALSSLNSREAADQREHVVSRRTKHSKVYANTAPHLAAHMKHRATGTRDAGRALHSANGA